jgi:hypothetical protein
MEATDHLIDATISAIAPVLLMGPAEVERVAHQHGDTSKSDYERQSRRQRELRGMWSPDEINDREDP